MKLRTVTAIPSLACIVAALVTSCGRAGAPPSPEARRGGRGDTISAPVASIDTAGDPAMRTALSRANAAAAGVDTILVQPDSLVLHVGQSVRTWEALKIEGRSASGQRIPQFAPLIQVADHSIAEMGALGLTGRRVGRTVLRIEPISLDSSVPAGRGRAQVRLIVVP